MPRKLVTFQSPRPRGGATAFSCSLFAKPNRLQPSSAYQAKISPTTAACASSSRTPAGAIGIEAVAVRRPRPGQQKPSLQLAKTATAHPLGDQAALVFGHRTTDLQQELIVRILAHRPVEEFHLTACGRDLFPQEHLMHVVARQPIRGRNQDAIQLAERRPVPQPLQPGLLEARPAVSIIAEDVLSPNRPALPEGMGLAL